MLNEVRTPNNDSIQVLKSDNQVLLGQLQTFVSGLTSDVFQQAGEPWRSGSIGAHVRHIIEHYLSVLNGTTFIDYDKRNRDKRVETCAKAASDGLALVVAKLDALDSDQACQVASSSNIYAPATATESSLARELSFLHSHTIHHMAIIRLLALSQEIDVGCDFGKAVSTLKFESHVQS